MPVRLLSLALLVTLFVPAVAGTGVVRAQDNDDLTIAAFLQAVEISVSTMDQKRWEALLSPSGDRDAALEFFDVMVPLGVTNVVAKERDRAPLFGALPGEGYRLTVEVFIETGSRGRIATWRLDIKRPRGEDLGAQPWRIVEEDRLASIDGLHRLSLHPEHQFAAKNLVLPAVDFELRLPQGDVFVAETAEGVTALVLVGDGTMVFRPQPKEERGQLRIFAGDEALETPFTAAFVRLNPFEFEQRVKEGMLEPKERDARQYRRAQAIFDEDVGKSFGLDLSDLSRDTWSLLPALGDFVAEVRTRRYDTVTYARSSSEAEDVTMFQRQQKRNIASYASEQKLSSRGRFFDEDDQVEYDVVDYNIDVALQPERDWLDGRAKLKIRVKSFVMAALTLRLANELTVSSVTSDELGRLLFLRVRNQNSIVVNLPQPVARDFQLNLTVNYMGRLEGSGLNDESVELQDPQRGFPEDSYPMMPPERKWLYSNRTYWYPQNQVTDYATGTMRITVPPIYDAVATGVPAPGFPIAAPAATPEGTPNLSYLFTAAQPVRYLGLLVSRMSDVDNATVALDIVPPPVVSATPAPPRPPSQSLADQIRNLQAGGPTVAKGIPPVGARNTVNLTMTGTRRQEGRARNSMITAAEILRLYSGLIGDIPYDALTVAQVEGDKPGGHAPAYFAMLDNPAPGLAVTWRFDPASFNGFPEFFIAHELAHQWFGQAVGWKNYHEQWLSEGFAQYFAALYARDKRGERAFRDILKQFQRWSLDQSDQGPVYLGYRLGHIKSEPRVFRALVYNKGASVLHMLRQIVGDEAFFAGVRRYYTENRFKKAGTDDLRRAMEAQSGRNLERFFERWIYDNGIPRLRFSSSVDGQELVARFEQDGEVYDVPVTVTLTYTDGRTDDRVVVVSSAATEARLPLDGTLKSVDVNQDYAAIAEIEKK